MAELPSVSPNALIHEINTLESDDTHQYHWKISRNSEKVSLFVKCILLAKSVTHEVKVVPRSFRVRPAGRKSRKKKMASALRRSANRLKHFLEKNAAEQALSKKSSVPSERTRKPSLCLPRTVVIGLKSVS